MGKKISVYFLNGPYCYFTTKKKGSGIGLSISKQIMRRHKGNIQVRSKLGEGTTFTLIFNG